MRRSRRRPCWPSGSGRRTITPPSLADFSRGYHLYPPKCRRSHLGTEAVTHSANLLHAQSLPDILNRSLDDGVNITGLVLGEPSTQIGFARLHVRDAELVTLEQVRDDRQVSALGELISEKLGVGVDAEDIGHEDDGLFGGLVVLGVGDVGVD